ncbi:FAD/NAD(P)-binding domain-containing protein [Gymnopus androsaceus JB14]|uniref:FAD/NAD(P)-binding domain-containing protein n=1 Tax=Gymnopus androsaceus JB14 TaxID=1447944 RepID=A0A6A4I7H0_9AGAR|nr:FAD/NAD(P)-binding domain-containing protein [Gymnopus androsaceus JB14]
MEHSSSSKLKWIVIGAGIAGLTSAYLLKEGGHSVVVLEKSSRRAQVANQIGGVRIPPNMSRLLQELPGAEKLLREKAKRCSGVSPPYILGVSSDSAFCYVDCKDDEPAELVGKMEFAEEIINDLGCDFHFMPHKDLHEYLFTLCTNAGVEIRHQFEVIDIISSKGDPNFGGPTAEFPSIYDCQVIGADGKNSVARKVLLAEEEEAEEEDSLDTTDSERSVLPPMKDFIGAIISIPVSLLQSDPELASFLREENYWTVFMANGMHMAMSQSGPDLCALDGTAVEKVLERAEGYDPRIKKLITLASTSHWYIQTVYDLPRHCVSKLDELVLIGDAVNSIYINGTHNTAAAFEEAFTLGRLFSISNTSALEHFEVNAMDTIVLLSLLPGPEREGRNNGFRLTLNLEGVDDATLQQVWAGYIMQFNYDARDAVDEWWMNWSRLGHRQSVPSFGVSITTAET